MTVVSTRDLNLVNDNNFAICVEPSRVLNEAGNHFLLSLMRMQGITEFTRNTIDAERG